MNPTDRPMGDDLTIEEWWRKLLTGDEPVMPLRQIRHVFSLFNGHPRCKFCNAPFGGRWGSFMRTMGRGPSRLTTQLCQQCQVVASKHLGGAEIEVTLLFADVRGSTKLGEQMHPADFSRLISRFFAVSSRVLLNSRAWVDRLVGDQVIGMYMPYFVGPKPEQVAIQAAIELLNALGREPHDGATLDVGVGVHSGTAFIGTVGSHDSATDITVLGDVPNVAARLSSAAAAGEILVSQEAFTRAGLPLNFEQRLLTVKGKSQPLPVYVLNTAARSA